MAKRAERLWWRLVRFGFRLLYHEAAFTYDLVSWAVSMGQWRCWGRTTLKYLPPADAGPVLEIAHGTGNLHLDLAAQGYDAVGVDLSPQMGRITRTKFRRSGEVPLLVRGQAQQLPFPDAYFSGVVCAFPAPFILEYETVAELYRVMRIGAPLVIVFNGAFTTDNVIVRVLNWMYRITGQRASQPAPLEPPFVFSRIGFDVGVEVEPCRGSEAHLLVANRPPAQNSG